MTARSLAPHVAEVAAALTAAGHDVTETWVEAGRDHCLAVQVGRHVLVLISDGQRPWLWVVYPALYPAGAKAAGKLAAVTVADVVTEVQQLVNQPTS